MKSGVGFLGVFVVGALAVAVADARPAKAASPTLRATVTEHQSTTAVATTVADAATTNTTADVVAPLSDAAVTGGELVTPPNPIPFLENPKLRRLQKKETSPAMLQAAAAIVRKYHAKPVGTQIEILVDGKHVVARIERHFHPEGGPVKPWGFHPGVSLFVYR
jgi:hypothetical protein